MASYYQGTPMKCFKLTLLIAISIVILVAPAWSHFGMLIPSDSMVMQNDSRSVAVNLSFSHPFEMVGMDMAKPKVFSVVAGGMNKDLLGSLESTRVMGCPIALYSMGLLRYGRDRLDNLHITRTAT